MHGAELYGDYQVMRYAVDFQARLLIDLKVPHEVLACCTTEATLEGCLVAKVYAIKLWLIPTKPIGIMRPFLDCLEDLPGDFRANSACRLTRRFG